MGTKACFSRGGSDRMTEQKRVKKIYKWRMVLVEVCDWCNGTGRNRTFHKPCFSCDGQGGAWKRKRVLVGEEVTE